MVVHSREVPVKTIQVRTPSAGPGGSILTTVSTAIVYERVLDDKQKAILEGARSLSAATGLDLEVVDAGKMGALSRVFSSLAGRGSVSVEPFNRSHFTPPADPRPPRE